MFALIRNALTVVPGCITGSIESRHRTAAAGFRAQSRLNARCRRANGGNTWLDLNVIEIEWSDETRAQGGRAVYAQSM